MMTRKNKKNWVLMLPLAMLAWTSCSASEMDQGNTAYEESDRAYAAMKDASEDGSYELEKVDYEKRRLKRNGNLSYQTEEILETERWMRRIIESHGGFVAGENGNYGDNGANINLTFKVPSEHFDSVMAILKKAPGELESAHVNSEDVTSEYVDLQSRLNAASKVEQRYLELLGEASTVEEIILVEDKLSLVRREVESITGHLKALTRLTDYSVISVSLHGPYEETEEGFFSSLGNAVSGGWNGLLKFLVAVAYAWPVWLALTVVTLWIRRFLRRNNLIPSKKGSSKNPVNKG